MRDAETNARTEETRGGGRSAARETAPLIAILAVYLFLAGVYLSRPGLAWDEALYIPYAEEIRGWFTGLPATANWKDLYNTLGRFTSHPPLATYVMAGTTQAFGNSIGRLYAARVASVVSMAWLLAAVYFFTARTRSAFAAVAAAGFLILMPQVFALSILATLDMPMAMWWFAAAALFYAACENRKLAWAAGLAAGLAFLTKIHALALPVVLWPWGLYFYGRKALPVIVWTAVLVPVVFFAGWPFLWAEPHIALGKYFGEKFPAVIAAYAAMGIDLTAATDVIHKMIRRTEVSVLYFGKSYTAAPWHYPFVITLITTPIAALFSAVVGAVAGRRTGAAGRLIAFLLWNAGFWLLVFAFAAKPYDGTRLFLMIFPFIAILAGMGVEAIWKEMRQNRIGRYLAPLAVALLYAGPVIGFLRIEPFGLSYYNGAVGGLPGAAAKGLPVTFWGETADYEITSYIDANAAEGARVAAFPMGRLYVENARFFGLVRRDIRDVEVAAEWDYLIIANRGDALMAREDIREMVERWPGLSQGPVVTRRVVTRRIEGVPAAWLVERKRVPARTPAQ